MPNTDELQISAWIPSAIPAVIPVTRFTVSGPVYGTLHQWCLERTRRTASQPTSIVLGGLSEILAFLAPEIAFMDPFAHDPNGGGPRRLALYLLGEVAGDAAIRRRVEAALNVWLGVIYPAKPADVRAELAASACDAANWSEIAVSSGAREHAGVCAVPQDGKLYDVLVAHTVGQLAGHAISFAAGDTRILVPMTPQSSTFGGIELVAFPPKKQADGPGLYTEVITLKAATFPERKGQGVHLLARPKMRNWGAIKSYDVNASPTRSLDVFMPAPDPTDLSPQRHTSFRFKARVDNWDEVRRTNAEKQITARWESHREERVFDLLRRLVGSSRLADLDLSRPTVGEEGLWVLPRLAPGSGDRRLAGGSGVGWPDRLDISESLDGALRQIGLERASPMRRMKGQMPINGPFHKAPDNAAAPAERRAALLKTLEALGNGSHLDVFLFDLRDEAPAALEKALLNLLGEPGARDGDRLIWGDGLTVEIVTAPPGPLSELLPEAQVSDAEAAGKTRQQREEMQKARQRQAATHAGRRMEAVVAAARRGRQGIACAILEMPQSFLGNARDPYALARRELARQRILPQVVLVVPEEKLEQKFRASVADWMRMLGVMPAFEHRLPMAPAALSLVQPNAQDVGGNTIETQALPLAVRVRDGLVECAIPAATGDPDWKPYAVAALNIFAGDYPRFGRHRDDDSRGRVHHFFANAVEQIDRHGEALVLLDADTLGQMIPQLQNGQLVFDSLVIGSRRYVPADLKNSRFVRFTADTAKLPSYYHADGAAWPTGLFSWENAERTAYGLKQKPASAKTTTWASKVSRHLEVGDNKAADDEPRRLATLDEICVAFRQPSDDMDAIRLLAHRLRQVHVQYGDDTRLPFPLHEIRLLSRAVTA